MCQDSVQLAQTLPVSFSKRRVKESDNIQSISQLQVERKLPFTFIPAHIIFRLSVITWVFQVKSGKHIWDRMHVFSQHPVFIYVHPWFVFFFFQQGFLCRTQSEVKSSVLHSALFQILLERTSLAHGRHKRRPPFQTSSVGYASWTKSASPRQRKQRSRRPVSASPPIYMIRLITRVKRWLYKNTPQIKLEQYQYRYTTVK